MFKSILDSARNPSSKPQTSSTTPSRVNLATTASSRLAGISLGSPGATSFIHTDSFERTPWTPEKDLIRRSEQQDPSVSAVSMWEGKAIEVQPDKEHTLFTYGLCGCQAVLLLGEHPDGKKTAILTHYPPSPIDNTRNCQQIKDLIRQHPDLKDEGVKLTSMTLVPGDYQENKKTGKWALIAKNLPLVDMLQSAIKNELGENVTEKVFPYSERLQVGKSSAFIIRFPAEENEPVRYEAHGTYYGTLDDKTPDKK